MKILELRLKLAGKDENLKIYVNEDKKNGIIEWTDGEKSNQYDFIDCSKIFPSSIQFWIKLNYFNVKGQLQLNEKNEFVLTLASTLYHFIGTEEEGKNYLDFLSSLDIPISEKFLIDSKESNQNISEFEKSFLTAFADTGCNYNLSESQRFELIKEGFLLEDSNNLGFNMFSKLHYAYPDKIYAKHFNGDVWRIVYLGQPSIIKHYVGKEYTCGGAFGYSINGTDSSLKYVRLGSLKFLNGYQEKEDGTDSK